MIMQRYFIAAMLVVYLGAPVLAEETFYIVYDSTMKGCTIVTTEPTDRPVLGSLRPPRIRKLHGRGQNVCFWHLADLDADDEHVCFWEQSGH
jgi:hypothetical protein